MGEKGPLLAFIACVRSEHPSCRPVARSDGDEVIFTLCGGRRTLGQTVRSISHGDDEQIPFVQSWSTHPAGVAFMQR